MPEEKNLTYKGAKIKITLNFSSETMQARREGSKIFERRKKKILKSVSCKVILQKWGRNAFSDKQKLSKFVANKPSM